MKRILPIVMVLAVLGVTACSSPPGSPAGGPRAFAKVDVRRSYDSSGRAAEGKLTVTDPVLINRLLSFFPGVDRPATSNHVAHYVSWATLDFFRADGSYVRVGTNYELWRNGLGAGDREVTPGFGAFLDQLFAGAATQPSGVSSR
jgi:hypothetical protein